MNFNHGTAQQRTIALILALSMAGSGAPLAVFAQEGEVAPAEENTSEPAQQEAAQDSSDEQSASGDEAAPQQDQAAMTTQSEGESAQEADDAQVEQAQDAGAQGEGTASAEARSEDDGSDSAQEGQEAAKELSVSVRVVGPDAEGNDVNWLEPKSVTLEEGKNGWDASATALADAGIAYDYSDSLKSVTSPLNDETYAADEATGKSWRLFVNGKATTDAASSVALSEGDTITWYYATKDATLEEEGKAEEEKSDDSTSDDGQAAGEEKASDTQAPHRAHATSWAGGRAFGVSDLALPVAAGNLAWDADLSGMTGSGSMGKPLMVNGDVYVTVGNVLCVLDNGNGSVKRTVELAGMTNATTHLASADGIVMVPLDGGRVQGITIDELTSAWVAEGDEAAGFIGAGPALVNGALLVASESGEVTAYNPTSGSEISKVSVGGRVRSGVVPGSDGSSAFLVTDEGTLHKLSVSAEGALAEAGKVQFAAHSGSTPTVCGGKVYVSGREGTSYGENENGDALYRGVLAVIGEGSMAVEKSISTIMAADGNQDDLSAEVDSSPLVSMIGGTHVYFTSEAQAGALYVYEDGADAAKVLYTPEESLRQGSVSSPASAGDGAVLYANGSGHLFKVVQGDDVPSTGVGVRTDAEAQSEIPQMSTDAGDNVIERSKTVTFSIAQKVPEDAATLLLWFDLDPAMEFTTTQDQFDNKLNGVDVTFDGNHVAVRVGNEVDEAAGLAPQAEGESSALSALRGKTITLQVSAKVRSDADLSSYVSDGNALIPYQSHARFTGTQTREVASQEAMLKVSPNASSTTQGTTTTTKRVVSKPATTSTAATSKVSTTKKATPNTADVTLGATALSMLAGWVLLAGSTLRRWTRRD